MYSAIHSADPPTEKVEGLKKFFESLNSPEAMKAFPTLKESQQIIWDEILNLYRLFRENDTDDTGVGGGETTVETSAVKKSYVTHDVIFESEKLETPSQVVDWSLWNRINARKFTYVEPKIQLRFIGGTIWIQGATATSPEQHYIKMFPAAGSMIIGSGNLMGFDVGFERFDADRGKFFLDVFEFPKELTSQISQEIPISSRKFRSVDLILTDALITDYTGAGLRFKCDLKIFSET